MPLNPSAEPWKKTLLAMAMVQFTMSASLMVQGPILPLFLPEIGVQPGGPVEFWSGVLSSVNFLVAAFVSPIWGSLSDRYGRKMMVLRSSIAICIFMGIMGFAHSLSELIALRALMGAFSGFSAAAIALVATQVPDNKLGYALGWLATSQLVGTLTGPVVGGAIADISGSYRVVFFCTSLIAAVAVIIAWLADPNDKMTDTGKPRRSFVKNLGMLIRTGGLLPLFGVLLIAQIGVRSDPERTG